MKNLYDRKVNVCKVIKTEDSCGSWTEEEAIVHFQLPCYILQVSAGKIIQSGRENVVRSHVMYCSVVDIQESYRIVDGNDRYEVLDVSSTRGEFLTIGLSIAE